MSHDFLPAIINISCRKDQSEPDRSRSGATSGPAKSDMVLHNVNTGAFEVYDIAGNNLVGAASLGAVGLDWQLGGFADHLHRHYYHQLLHHRRRGHRLGQARQ